MKIRPIGNYITVIRDQPTNISTIYHELKPSGRGIVQAVGSRVTYLSPGDLVCFNPYSGKELHITDSPTLLFLLDAEIYGLIDK